MTRLRASLQDAFNPLVYHRDHPGLGLRGKERERRRPARETTERTLPVESGSSGGGTPPNGDLPDRRPAAGGGPAQRQLGPRHHTVLTFRQLAQGAGGTSVSSRCTSGQASMAWTSTASRGGRSALSSVPVTSGTNDAEQSSDRRHLGAPSGGSTTTGPSCCSRRGVEPGQPGAPIRGNGSYVVAGPK
jgi:hypothetical protein